MTSELELLMGKEVYNRFAVQYYHLAKSDACRRGYGSMLPAQVTPVVEWYAVNKQAMDQYVTDHPDERFVRVWLEFKEMFIDRNNLSQITQLAELLDAGVMASFGDVSTCDLYSLWKSGHRGSNSSGRFSSSDYGNSYRNRW